MPLTLDTSEIIDAIEGDGDPSLADAEPNGEQVADGAPVDYDDRVTVAADDAIVREGESPAAAPQLTRYTTDPAYIRAKEIEHARDRLCAATMAEMRAKSAAKIAKAERELAAEALSELMRGPDAVATPSDAGSTKEVASSTDAAPADVESSDTPLDESAVVATATTKSTLPAPPPDDDEWRDCDLGDLDIAEAILGKLSEHGIENLGELSDTMGESKNGEWFADIDGVGRAKADKIEDALQRFWAGRKVGT